MQEVKTSVVIHVQGEELEVINVELTSEEVKSIYLQRKELTKQIQELEKKLQIVESNNKYTTERMLKAAEEVNQANILLSALGVESKSKEEESWRRTDLSVATRIALYIASNK